MLFGRLNHLSLQNLKFLSLNHNFWTNLKLILISHEITLEKYYTFIDGQFPGFIIENRDFCTQILSAKTCHLSNRFPAKEIIFNTINKNQLKLSLIFLFIAFLSWFFSIFEKLSTLSLMRQKHFLTLHLNEKPRKAFRFFYSEQISRKQIFLKWKSIYVYLGFGYLNKRFCGNWSSCQNRHKILFMNIVFTELRVTLDD